MILVMNGFNAKILVIHLNVGMDNVSMIKHYVEIKVVAAHFTNHSDAILQAFVFQMFLIVDLILMTPEIKRINCVKENTTWQYHALSMALAQIN